MSDRAPGVSALNDRALTLAAGTAGAVTVAGMIATPLVTRGGAGRRALSTVVVGGMFVTSTVNAVRRWGPRRAGLAAATTAAGTALVERVGTTTGLPFGRYRYTGVLRPEVAGVPAIVPMAWFGMGLPAREAADAALRGRSTRTTRVVLGAFALTAWDLFLDPQMVGEGYWRWARRGAYRGIPLTNFAGWLLTSAALMLLLERTLPPHAETRHRTDHGDGLRAGPTGPTSPESAGAYVYMAVMQTLGFAAFFRDPLVALVGGGAMLPVAVAVARSMTTGRR